MRASISGAATVTKQDSTLSAFLEWKDEFCLRMIQYFEVNFHIPRLSKMIRVDLKIILCNYEKRLVYKIFKKATIDFIGSPDLFRMN